MPVEMFESLDEMQAELHRRSSAADASVRPWQEAVGEGGKFVVYDSLMKVVIYCEVARSDYPEDKAADDALFASHHRPVRAYSAICTEGELGIYHVASIQALLTDEAWEGLKEDGWPRVIDGYRIAVDPSDGHFTVLGR